LIVSLIELWILIENTVEIKYADKRRKIERL